MKVLRFISENILFILALFFIAFIPLYPKLPLLDIRHTWVYIRIEDFVVAFAGLIFLVQLLRKKATLRTPLTIPILLFLAIGAISTVYAIYFIFPTLADLFPQIALLHYFRRVEYLLLFFVGFSAMRRKSFLHIFIAVMSITLLLVVIYGLGQKGFLIGWENRLPAFSTMNEEFAKGIPLKLSALARIPSTFAGHYDLAAYLVLLIPIMGSLVFGYKKLYLKAFFFLCGLSGLILLFLTSSRVSVAVYLVTISFMILLQKTKLLYKGVIILVVIVSSMLLMNMFEGITERFARTISSADVIIDARTGLPIGIASEGSDGRTVIEDRTPTGESLPQGSGYLGLRPGSGTSLDEVTYRRVQIGNGGQTEEITNIEGEFIIQQVFAYDLSFTTRFQGQWPRAMEAYKRNPLLGSGYSSISLATDNNYLRILGEVGLLGLLSFLGIFLMFGIYVKKVLPHVTDRPTRAFVVGVVAALVGLGLNAVLIDVFEASKVAFVLWLLMGVTTGTLALYKVDRIHYFKELFKVFTSIPAIIVYLFILLIFVYGRSISNFFVGDDFTWLRWAADCQYTFANNGITKCGAFYQSVADYFLHSDGFFYRPGTKTFFLYMYPIFALGQHAYHIVSLLLHFVVTVLVLLVSLKILRNKLFATMTALVFLTLSSHSEVVFWVSALGHLVAFAGILASLLFFIYWRETKHFIFFLLSIPGILVAPLFHEVGIVGPVVIVFYDLINNFKDAVRKPLSRWFYGVYLFVIPAYLFVRAIAGSHWLNGDYNYNFVKLPVNALGNLVGYAMLTFGGTHSYGTYETLRIYSRDHAQAVWIGSVVFIGIAALMYWLYVRHASVYSKKTFLTILMLIVVPLTPFLGLGNIAFRYDYYGSFGFILLVMIVLRKIYSIALRFGKTFAFIVAVTPVAFFVAWQVSEVQRINEDWQKAGEISQRVLVAFGEPYDIVRIVFDDPVYYFVNTPIKEGDAWVFPVGLDDAMWFMFQDENLTVHEIGSLDVAFDQAEGSESARVFEFDDSGNVNQVLRSVNQTSGE